MSRVFKCIIVDDEPAAIRLLEKFIEKVSFLKLINTFTKPIEALLFIRNNNVDLLFLDIQMPEITGIQLSKIVSNNVQTIFTTAYPKFALESYDVAAIDYLLKPIEFGRFYKAVSKLLPLETANETTVSADNYIFLKTDGKNKFVKVFLEEILFIEGLKNYVSVQLKDEQIITNNTLKHLRQNLMQSHFIQIHKSYIISLKHIDRIDNDVVWIKEKELPIGNTYRKLFFEKISENKL